MRTCCMKAGKMADMIHSSCQADLRLAFDNVEDIGWPKNAFSIALSLRGSTASIRGNDTVFLFPASLRPWLWHLPASPNAVRHHGILLVRFGLGSHRDNIAFAQRHMWNPVTPPTPLAATMSPALAGRRAARRRRPRRQRRWLLLKRSEDRGWGTTVKWFSGLSLCVCVRACFVGYLSKAPLFPSRALLK